MVVVVVDVEGGPEDSLILANKAFCKAVSPWSSSSSSELARNMVFLFRPFRLFLDLFMAMSSSSSSSSVSVDVCCGSLRAVGEVGGDGRK